MEVAEPITKSISESDVIKVYALPLVEKMACIVHKGPFSTIGESYQNLSNWITENRYTLCGPVREIYHKGDWTTDNPEEYITELQFPIK